LEPVLDLFGEVADDIAVERRCVVDEDVAAGWGLELALPDLINVADDLLNRVLPGGRVSKIVPLGLLELENRDGVAGFIIAAISAIPSFFTRARTFSPRLCFDLYIG
jgi:hypothetical protein